MTQQKSGRLVTLEEFIIRRQNRFPGATGEFSQLLRDIGLAGKIIAREVSKAGFNNILGSEGNHNIHGESVQKLDSFADRQLILALGRSDITSMVISEENEEAVHIGSPTGKYIVYLDPLDGSGNIDVNVSIGSIFSIYMRTSRDDKNPSPNEALQEGRKQVAAGYVLYGSSTTLVYTTGLGVSMFTLDPSIGEFILAQEEIRMPERGTIYSVNEGHYKAWSEGLKKYIKFCQQVEPEDDRPYSARYIGAMVADVHRTLIKGGIFIYPASEQYPEGKLRLMYECNPLAFIIEQAGGTAVNGNKSILDITPRSIHQRTPIYIGSAKNVERVRQYLNASAEVKS